MTQKTDTSLPRPPRPRPDDVLQVTVCGSAKAGKTTVARIIADALKRAGFDNVVNLDNGTSAEGLHPVEADRVRRFAEGRRVRIISANVTRQALAKGAR